MPSSTADKVTHIGSAALTWSVSVALLAWLGSLLDEALASSPWFLLVGALLGAVGGFIHFLARVAPDMLPFGRRRDETGSDSDSSNT